MGLFSKKAKKLVCVTCKAFIDEPTRTVLRYVLGTKQPPTETIYCGVCAPEHSYTLVSRGTSYTYFTTGGGGEWIEDGGRYRLNVTERDLIAWSGRGTAAKPRKKK